MEHSLTENFRKNWFGSGRLEAEVNWRSKSGGEPKGDSERICFNPPTGWGSDLRCAEVFKGQCPRWPFPKLDRARPLAEGVLSGLGSFLLGPERVQGGEGARLFRVPVKGAAAELAKMNCISLKI